MYIASSFTKERVKNTTATSMATAVRRQSYIKWSSDLHQPPSKRVVLKSQVAQLILVGTRNATSETQIETASTSMTPGCHAGFRDVKGFNLGFGLGFRFR